jgi:hypothetical protein
MKNSQSLVKYCRTDAQSLMLVVSIMMGVFLAGCQGSMITGKGKSIDPVYRIVITKGGQQSGQFSSEDLTLNYTYTRTGNTLELSGVVQFSDVINGNYNAINRFDLGLILADAQGIILEQHGLTTGEANRPSAPINFREILALPPQCETMAFTYNAQVSGVTTGPVALFHYPVVR